MPAELPLLLAGHGSRDEVGAEAFRAFVAELADRLPMPVAGGFIELSTPALGDAVADLVGRGHLDVVAVPLMLVAAGHTKGDIPASLARERQRHPGLRFRYGRPLGPDPILLDELSHRLDAVLGPADRGDTVVLLVGRGSSDPDANGDVVKTARLLWEGRGLAGVETAFISLAQPDLPAGLDRCRRLGAGRIVVLPFFLFPGVLPDRILAQSSAWRASHPQVEVRVADVLGASAGLAGLVAARYHEAIEGDIRMNCDTCIYRVALPGFEHRQGEPQHPHHHPDDGHDRSAGHRHHEVSPRSSPEPAWAVAAPADRGPAGRG